MQGMRCLCTKLVAYPLSNEARMTLSLVRFHGYSNNARLPTFVFSKEKTNDIATQMRYRSVATSITTLAGPGANSPVPQHCITSPPPFLHPISNGHRTLCHTGMHHYQALRLVTASVVTMALQ